MRRFAKMLAALCIASAPLFPGAQGYPAKPIHFIVAFAPGGPVDVVARLVGAKIPQVLGHPSVVENRPSSTGNLGTQVVAKSAPDGYTVPAPPSAFAVNVTLSPKPAYDPAAFR